MTDKELCMIKELRDLCSDIAEFILYHNQNAKIKKHLKNKLGKIEIERTHEYEYLSTSGFKGYRCKKCGQSIKE